MRVCSLSVVQSVRDYVDKVPQCADIALNLLVAELTDSSPLLFVNSDKRVTEDVASSIEDHTRIGSACLNDLEAILGSMALRNSSEARMHLEQDTFTKVRARVCQGPPSSKLQGSYPGPFQQRDQGLPTVP